jgi:two-component sensor histidine kinase
MTVFDDLTISLIVLFALRFIAALVFLDLVIREKESKYVTLFLGWLIYAIGPVFGVLEYSKTGNFNHPFFGYSAAFATLLLMCGIILYHFYFKVKFLVITLTGYFLIFFIAAYFFPKMGGLVTIIFQLTVIIITLLAVIFLRKWFLKNSGLNSYLWLLIYFVYSVFHAFAFVILFGPVPFSVRFVLTFVSNLILLLFFLHFDRESSFTIVRASEKRLTLSLAEKDILLKEINHRVKNNMGIIYSLLSLQIPYLSTSEAIQQFEAVQNRIKAMSIVHEMLYGSKDLSQIKFKEYVEKLSEHIKKTVGENVTFELHIEDIKLEYDILIPCGLIINEIITNSIKHGFVENENNCVTVSVFLKNKSSFILKVSDNGIGLPDGFSLNNSDGLGTKLIQNLTQQ